MGDLTTGSGPSHHFDDNCKLKRRLLRRRKKKARSQTPAWELDGWARKRGRRERGATLPSLPREDAREEDEEDRQRGRERGEAPRHLPSPQTVLSARRSSFERRGTPRAPPSPRKGGAGSRGGVACGRRSRPRIFAFSRLAIVFAAALPSCALRSLFDYAFRVAPLPFLLLAPSLQQTGRSCH